jgi:beta-galactosidase/beta-glucuronidase
MHKNVLSYEKGHPNPLFYRATWQSLNGTWPFLFDDDNKGLALGYQVAVPPFTLSIAVPYAYETRLSGVEDHSNHSILWYWRKFQHPGWGKRMLLHIERCDYVFDAWLNGTYLGKHVGGYDAFQFDVTGALQFGENLLAIRVYDDRDPAHVRGKQTWKDEPFGEFYEPTSGIYGDVWIEEADEQRLLGYDARGSYEDRSAYLRLLFAPSAIGALFTLGVSYRGEEVATESFTVDKEYIELPLSIKEAAFHAWTPSQPSLYDVEMTLTREGEEKDTVFSYFGINEIRQRGDCLTINGKKRFLKLILDQGYYLDGGLTGNEEAYASDLTFAKKMGFNGVRCAQHVPSELYYYLADREGLFTTLELPSTHYYDPVESQYVASQWGCLVRDHVGHPSIVAYIAFDESQGIESVKDTVEVQEFASSLYDMANRIDWTRPVVSNDGYEHTKSDVVSLHNYAENGRSLLAFYDGLGEKQSKGLNFRADKDKEAFAGEYHYAGQPLFLSEFFGPIFRADVENGWGHGKNPVYDGEAFIHRYKSLLRAIRKLGFAGYCASELCDVAQQKDGFLTEERKAKVALSAVKEANDGF